MSLSSCQVYTTITISDVPIANHHLERSIMSFHSYKKNATDSPVAFSTMCYSTYFIPKTNPKKIQTSNAITALARTKITF